MLSLLLAYLVFSTVALLYIVLTSFEPAEVQGATVRRLILLIILPGSVAFTWFTQLVDKADNISWQDLWRGLKQIWKGPEDVA